MKKIIYILVLMFTSFMLSSCVFGHAESGPLTEIEYKAEDADRFEVKNVSARVNNISSFGPMIKFHKSDTKKIVMSFQESMANEIRVTYEDGKMLISSNLITVYFTDYEINIDIYGYEFKEVTANSAATLIFEEGTVSKDKLDIYLSGASSIEIANLKIDKINFEVGGASWIYLPKIEANDMKVILSGASNLLIDKLTSNKLVFEGSGASSFDVTGEAEELDLKLSGGSKIKSYDFVIDEVKLNIEGGSEVECTVTSSVSGKAKGGSKITCKGRPAFDVETSGGSTVKVID